MWLPMPWGYREFLEIDFEIFFVNNSNSQHTEHQWDKITFYS